MAIMTHAKFHFNWLMLTSIFCIWASESPRAWRTTEKAGPDRVKSGVSYFSTVSLPINQEKSTPLLRQLNTAFTPKS